MAWLRKIFIKIYNVLLPFTNMRNVNLSKTSVLILVAALFLSLSSSLKGFTITAFRYFLFQLNGFLKGTISLAGSYHRRFYFPETDQ